MDAPDSGLNPYLPPASPVEGEPAPAPEAPVPWEDREGIPGFWARVGAMFSLAFTAPTELIARVARGESLSAPWTFTVLLALPGLFLVALIFLVVGVALLPGVLGRGAGPSDPPPALLAGIGFGALLLMPLFYFVQMLLWGLVNHACLWIWGGTRQGQPLLQTLRATGYACAFLALGSFIPLVNYALMVAVPAVLGMGLARLHRTDTWRGVCAAFTPVLLCCCAYAGIFATAFIAGASKGR